MSKVAADRGEIVIERHDGRDGVLTIRADNRTAVYVIGERDPELNRWELSWPD